MSAIPSLRALTRLVPPLAHRYRSRVLFKNIPPYVLHAVNGDLAFRKEWDGYVLNLDVIDRQGEVEYVLWGCKFPWPMSNRDYVYARRCTVIPGDSGASPIYVTVAKACAHPAAPETSSFVRVDVYTSVCAFRAVDDQTTECITLYEDDMKGSIPVTITNYFTRTAMPAFRTTLIGACEKYMDKYPDKVQKVREAALALGSSSAEPAATS